MIVSLVPSPPPQLSSLAVQIFSVLQVVIRTANNDSCGGGLGTRIDNCIPGVRTLVPQARDPGVNLQ